MNFYGPTAGPQHTIYGRIAPMMEAMRLAICRAVELPAVPAKMPHEVPAWVHRIADELTTTVFKGIVNLGPATKKYRPHEIGQMVGLLIRMAIFYWKEAKAIWEREGFNRLTPEQKTKLEKITGWEHACRHASEVSGQQITTKKQLLRYWRLRLFKFALSTGRVIWTLVKFTLNRPVEDIFQFMMGLPKGFKCFLNTDGEIAKTGKRTEVYFVLLSYWPEIEEMRRAQPSLTRPYLLKWLEKQEGKELTTEKIFCELCDDIGLDMAPPGHPFTTNEA
jgi:hypothetical protein